MSWYHEDLPMSDPVFRAIAMVRQRLIRVVEALEKAEIPFAVCGGWAVAGWVAEIDEHATRSTRDVDILLRRVNLDAAIAALEPYDFYFQEVNGVPLFLDGPEGIPSMGVHILWANEKIRKSDLLPVPDVEPTFTNESHPYPRVNFYGIVLMKLLAWRLHDQAALYDMIRVGILKEDFVEEFEGELRERLQSLFDNPEENLG